MAPYVNEFISLSEMLSDTPPDLRVISEPLLDTLSHSSAGFPGDDVADLRRIRDFWIRTKARELSLKGSYKLRIRIGTFNVNGKLPSQDLSTWVGGSSLPSTKQSEFQSLGIYVDDTQADEPPVSHSSIKCKAPDQVFTPSCDESETADTGPDLLVLGFQELDHSAEAFIYTANPTREDAWCTAVVAALGERGSRYEKLISRQLVGILIVIFVRKSIRSYFTDVKTCEAGAGLMGVMVFHEPIGGNQDSFISREIRVPRQFGLPLPLNQMNTWV